MFSANGPPKGQNVTSNQSSYDIVFKDIIVNYPPLGVSAGSQTKYTVSLPNEFDKIYRVELVCANIHFNDITAADSSIPVNVRNSTIIVSIPQLNNRTLFLANQVNTPTGYTSEIFCQIPDNYTPLGGGNGTGTYPANCISTFIGGPPFSAEQFYNPPLSNINQLDIYLLDIYGNNLLNATAAKDGGTPDNATTNFVASFYMTLRIYYMVKRNNTTAFSEPLFNYAASGTIDSIFSNTKIN
jgi:hypothetical protein